MAAAIARVAPGLVVEEVDVVGPPTSVSIRGAGWVEAAVLLASLADASSTPDVHSARVEAPSGAVAAAVVALDGSVHVELWCGQVLDEVVLRSYVIGAAHMAIGWVTSEGLAVDEDGRVSDLTIRSFGILRAADMPRIEVTLHPEDRDPVNGSDAAFAAVAAATWAAQGYQRSWPTGRPLGARA